jgi:hypothetical protein
MANVRRVDDSDVWKEGMHVSAVIKGHAPEVWAAADNRICGCDWKIDFGRLFHFAAG